MNTYETEIGKGTGRLFVDNGLYIGREDGVGEATTQIIRAQIAGSARADVADVIVCNGSNHTPSKDLQAGIRNAHELLREGGMLVVRSLAKPASTEIGTDQIVEWAYENGFPESSIEYSATYKSLAHTVMTGSLDGRLMKSVVLTK